MNQALLISLLVLSITGCSLQEAPTSTAPTGGVSTPAFTPIPTLTRTPTQAAAATSTPAVSPTAASTYQPFSFTTSAANVALRKGPGYLFARIGLLPEGTSLTVLGRSRGGEWALARTTDGSVGWIFVLLVDAGDNKWAEVPTSEPLGAQLVTGMVKDEAGVPISGIQFAFTQGSGSLAPRTDAMTDGTGTFYAYLPADARGQWYLSYTAVACTSNVMDANCNPKNGIGGRPEPDGQYITLPLDTATPLQFVWK